MHEVIDTHNRYKHIRWFDCKDKAEYFIDTYKGEIDIVC